MFKWWLSNIAIILMLLPLLLELKLTMQGPTKHSRSFCGKLFDSQHGTRTRCFFCFQTNIEHLNWHNLFLPLYCRLCFILLYLFVPQKEYFLLGQFGLIYNRWLFFFEMGQCNHNSEGWTVTVKGKSIELSICRKPGQHDFSPFFLCCHTSSSPTQYARASFFSESIMSAIL